MNLFKSLLAAVAVLALSLAGLAPMPALASPASYVTTPNDVPYILVNQALSNVNASGGQFGSLALGTASANAATINSTRTLYTTASLATAASAISTAQTETNSTVVASSMILCATQGYAGTGVPVVVNIVPGAGSFTFQIQNVSTGAALNAAVNVACIVFN